MKRHHKTTVGLFMVLIAACAFLIAPVFVQAQEAQADQSEIDSLLNSSHVTSWAYYTDPTGKWFISSSSGVTYALGRNSQNHASWIAIADQGAVATVDFSNKKVSLRTDTAARTPDNSYLAISLVDRAAETVRGGWAREFANLINGNTLDLKWYFFRVESTEKWYIVQINGTDSTIYRLKLNDTIDRPTEGCPVKGCYDWQMPLDRSGVAVNTSNWTKSFFQENGAWKVRFNTSSVLNSFQWPIPIPAGATIDSQATTTMDFYDSSGRRYLYKAGFEFLEPTGTTYPPCGGNPRVDFHPGIDINVVGTSRNGDIGTPVYAIADGTVTGTASGGSIVIKHPVGDGTSVWANYRHTRAITVASGNSVRKGQQIAEMGDAGATGAAHLHFEVRKSGHPDPASAQFWCGYGGLSDTALDNWLYNPLQFIRDHR